MISQCSMRQRPCSRPCGSGLPVRSLRPSIVRPPPSLAPSRNSASTLSSPPFLKARLYSIGLLPQIRTLRVPLQQRSPLYISVRSLLPKSARRFATQTKTEEKEQEAKTEQGGGTGGRGGEGDEGGGGGGGGGDGRPPLDDPNNPNSPETWETRRERLTQFYDEVLKAQSEGDPELQPRLVMSQRLPLGQNFPEWTARQRAEQESAAKFFYATYGPDKGRVAFLWWARREQNYATYEYAEFLREFPNTEVQFDKDNNLRVFFKGVELEGTTLDVTINKKLARADELRETNQGHGGDDFVNWRPTIIAPETTVHDLTWRLPFWLLIWAIGLFIVHYIWQELLESFDKQPLRSFFADPRVLEPALRDIADFVVGMDIVQERLGVGGDISVDLGSFRLYHHGREVEFMFLMGGDLGVAASTVTFERELQAEGNFLGMSLTRRMVIRPKYCVIELPLDHYAEFDFVGTRKYACNKPDQMVEIIDGTLMFDNFKTYSWIQENMEYEKVQDKKIREAFEVDMQESKLHVIKTQPLDVQETTLGGLRKLEDFTRRLHAANDHASGRGAHPSVEEDNLEALQGRFLKQLREERNMRKLPEFRGETVWEMEEDKKMQVTALEMALHKRKEDYWKAKAKEQMAAYEAAMNREAASQREDTEVGGQRLVRQQPRAGQEQQQ